MTEPEPETPAFSTEEWVYLGPYWSEAGRVGHRWRDESGRRLGFAKVKGRVYGAVYTVQVERQGDRITAYEDPTWTGRYCDDRVEVAVRGERQARDIKLHQMDKNASRTAALDELIESLLEHVTPLMPDDKRAVADYVSHKIMATRRRK